MKQHLIPVLLSSVVGLLAGDLHSPIKAQKYPLSNYVSFPACGIKIRQPEGFEKADSFDGFAHSQTLSSVMVMCIPGPYSKVTAGLTPQRMKARGWTLQSKQNVRIDGLPGILISFQQPVGGQVLLKWLLGFGDERKTTIVMATFPKTHEQKLSAQLKLAVLSTRLEQVLPPKPGSDLPFTLRASQKLKLTPAINKTLAYTKDGIIPTKSVKDPLFVVAPAVSQVVVTNKRQFAERRLYQTALVRKLTIKSADVVTIDGIDGYELLAEGEDTKSGTPLLVYQVILFNRNSYILMQGLVGTELGDEYLPEFKAMARSFKRK